MNTRSLALAGLVVLAALTRLLPHPENFAPITAMAVFAAIRFGSPSNAVLAPLVALLLSDLGKQILYQQGLVRDWGLYEGMWAVYGATALVALFGRLAQGSRSAVVIAGATVGGSCLFFLVTNFGVWAAGTIYPQTTAGLMQCYVAAIPFFTYSLTGDLVYATVLFGGWALAEARFPVLRPAPALANA
jgi:Family of unknown function (DUF6580)